MMTRPNNKNRSLHAALGLVLAIGLGGARTEKIWAEAFNGLDLRPAQVSLIQRFHEPFDPRRVPQSGGMASRLLAGIVVKQV
jgi:hypothetical protein